MVVASEVQVEGNGKRLPITILLDIIYIRNMFYFTPA